MAAELIVKINLLTKDAEAGAKRLRASFAEMRRVLIGSGLALSGFAAAGVLLAKSLIKAAREAGADDRAFREFDRALKSLKVTVGKDLIEALTPLMDVLTRLLRSFDNMDPRMRKIIVVGALVAVAIAGILGPLALLLAAIPGMVAGIGLLTGAFAGLSIAMGPITLIVLGIAAAVAAGIMLWRNWEHVMEGVRGTASWLARVLDALGINLDTAGQKGEASGKRAQSGWERFIAWLRNPNGAGINAALKLIFGFDLADLMEQFQKGWEQFKALVKSYDWDITLSVLTLGLKKVDWKQLWKDFWSLAQAAWDWIKNYGWEVTLTVLTLGLNKINWVKLWADFWSLIQGVWNYIRSHPWEIILAVLTLGLSSINWAKLWADFWTLIQLAWDWIKNHKWEITLAVLTLGVSLIDWEDIKPKLQAAMDAITQWWRDHMPSWMGGALPAGPNFPMLAPVQPGNPSFGPNGAPTFPSGDSGGYDYYDPSPAEPSHWDPTELAHGGRVTRRGRAIVGERGPELLTLPRGAEVAPLGRSGPTSINVNVSGPIYGFLDFDRAVKEAVRKALQEGAFRGYLATV